MGNRELELARKFISETQVSVFLSGKAGTGKTTFLRQLQSHSPKRKIVVAPTGVAAINAGGVTIHSFFQLPFSPYVPLENGVEVAQKFNKTKLNIIRTLELLIIDEISMVRADLLDAIDAVLRKLRGSDRPFGGVQLLMIGDLQQLSPVAKQDDWEILQDYYKTLFFFSSRALKQTDYVNIELKHIYRQTDDCFIKILNEIREGVVGRDSFERLQQRYIENLDDLDLDSGYITLCTHNFRAEQINVTHLAKIETESHVFKADVFGDFPEYSFPTYKNLEIKKGAQVMFVRNDMSKEKRFFNGKIGVVQKVTKRSILVQCDKDDEPILVTRELWDNVKYKLNNQNSEIEENVVGTFSQFPLKLAWAITIHKSQGLTFDKAIIDAQAAFAHGQVYVALSRCRTLEGVVLSSPILEKSIICDRSVMAYNQLMSERTLDDALLNKCRIQYKYHLLSDLFDFRKIEQLSGRLNNISKQSRSPLQGNYVELYDQYFANCIEEVFDVAPRFQRQLDRYVAELMDPSDDEAVLERLTSACRYFLDKIEERLLKLSDNVVAETDNLSLQQTLDRDLNELFRLTHLKRSCLLAVSRKFDTKVYLRAYTKATIHPPVRVIRSLEVNEGNVNHPELLKMLKDWRKKKADQEFVSVSKIVSAKVLLLVANKIPRDVNELKSVKGVGKRSVERHGLEISRVVRNYCQEFKPSGIQLPNDNLFDALD